jgi:hypothetical protein
LAGCRSHAPRLGARSALGDPAEGIAWIEKGMGDFRATESKVEPFLLALKAEALHLADRTSEALEAIKKAEKVVERSEERQWYAELHRLRGVFLATLGVASVAALQKAQRY